jgi:hypothetical protein
MGSDRFTVADEATMLAMNRSKTPMNLSGGVSRKKDFVQHFGRMLDSVFSFF